MTTFLPRWKSLLWMKRKGRPSFMKKIDRKASIVHYVALFSAKAELRFLGFIPARLASESVAGRWKP